MSSLGLLSGVMIVLILLAVLFSYSAKKFKEVPSDPFKNALELTKVAAIVTVAGFTFMFVDQQRQALSQAEYDLKVYQTFFGVSASNEVMVRLHTLKTIDTYRASFLPPGSRLDNALVALTKTILERQDIQVQMAAPENAILAKALSIDRSPILRGVVKPVFETLGSLDEMSDTQYATWIEQNIVSFGSPFALPVAWDTQKSISKFKVNKLALPFFESVFREIQSSGLKSSIEDFGGTFAARRKRGSGRYSVHAYGTAIDININKNPIRTAGNMDPKLVALFKKNGFIWGGDFATPDPMHFEVDPELLASQKTEPSQNGGSSN